MDDKDVKIAVLEERIRSLGQSHADMKTDIDTRIDKLESKFDSKMTEATGKIEKLSEAIINATIANQDSFNEIKTAISEAKTGVTWSYKSVAFLFSIVSALVGLGTFIAKHW